MAIIDVDLEKKNVLHYNGEVPVHVSGNISICRDKIELRWIWNILFFYAYFRFTHA